MLLLMLAGACVDGEDDDKAPEPPEPNPYTCAERDSRSAAEEVLAAGLYDECEHDGQCVFAGATTACAELCDRQVVNRNNQEGFAEKIAAIDETYCATYLADGCSHEPPACQEETLVPICEAGHCTTTSPGPCQSEAPSTIVRAELFAGACTEDCGHVLVFDERAGPCDRVAMTFADMDPATPNQTVHGTLTPLGLPLAQRLTSRLEGVQLEEMYPCPSCDDFSGMRLLLRRQNVESEHTYDPNAGFVPDVLAEANGFVVSLILSLSDCEASSFVVPAADCRSED